jgi:IclR helix-turn-helix domain
MIARKQAKTEGRDGFPVAWQWLADLGVKPGEFQVETTARLQLAMKSREWPEKQRVWACLSLATMGFNQELAVKLEKGKVVPLTQTDIAKQTGIAVNNVHRCVLDLESEGWLKRIPVDEGRGLRKGEVQIHCYAIPRPPKKPRAIVEDPKVAGSEYDGLPDEVAYWLRHLKFHAPGPEKVEQVKSLCLAMSATRDELKELCRPEPDQMTLPGVSVNTVKVSRLAKSKDSPGPVAVEPPLARGSQKDGCHLRANGNGTRARTLPNKEEIKGNKSTVGRSVESSSETDRPTEKLLQAIIESGITEKLNDVPSKKLLQSIAETLNGIPVEFLKNRIHLRWDSITSLGMLPRLAGDLAAANAVNGKRAGVDHERMNAAETRRLENLKTEARRILESEQSSEEDQEWARETLAQL